MLKVTPAALGECGDRLRRAEAALEESADRLRAARRALAGLTVQPDPEETLGALERGLCQRQEDFRRLRAALREAEQSYSLCEERLEERAEEQRLFRPPQAAGFQQIDPQVLAGLRGLMREG